jgi:hypothetical protein
MAHRDTRAEEMNQVMDTVSWGVDMVITNDAGDRVWLREFFDAHGQQVGITDCCLETSPCEWHSGYVETTKKGYRNSKYPKRPV